ncbi:polyisoprenoid-binding protein YceI [Dysgonomonas sp. PFB1-18]|uniref:YceI family protein n=1 Tax=unclassified Dysgonomonas TaxID=2630389 RepID=UPI0024754FF7|nr:MULTISPECIES: YceI family protein [unclassified Dysgonomonas]MDH6307738.1 polyisoprenoid-binding protein YceI [Dysgonomonas sp. PF1-14]MDH6337656.1 polyisoprenoid-binding protein YceI [Dysgonomonas sp. PF1-16]MDH6378880.1 polyisoprenoid-binding protein YceI [Dysgonomonas sp. PFB1-18]MDH6396515.1 polyisoprenoid-binding protein YceI [Dysgonomonas sp. PF1-23]
MKKYLIALSVLVFAVSCNNAAKNKVEGTDAQAAASGAGEELVVDTQASSIQWKGSKVGGSHNGTIALKAGTLAINGETVASGSFEIDMNAIVDEDLTQKDMNDMLVNHLKSADFFDVATYPSSTFTVTKVEAAATPTDSVNYMVSGNLKLKDVEKNITFGAKITKEGDTYKAVTVPFTIDRTQWNVKYGSKTLFADLKENIVNDNIELQITIVAKAAAKPE